MGDPLVAGPMDRIAAAIGRLRARGVVVHESVEATAVRYEAVRPAYRVLVYVDPDRFIGLEFDLFGADGSVRLHYFADTDLYAIAQPRHAWLAAAAATDVALLLDALAGGELLAKVEPRRACVIVPTGDGPRIVTRSRIWTTAGRHRRDRDADLRDGFRPVAW